MPKEGEKKYLSAIGEDGILHAVNKPFSDPDCGLLLSELGAIFQLMPRPPKRLLDIGCGTGWTSRFFARHGYDVVGLDISEEMIEQALNYIQTKPIKNLEFVVGDFEELKEKKLFDCAVFFSSLHHAEDPEQALKAVFNCLKAGGVCVCSEPGKGHSKSQEAVEAMQKYNVTERDMPPGLIRQFAANAGFSSTKFYPHATTLNNLVFGNEAKLDKTRLLKLLKKFIPIRTLALLLINFYIKHQSGIVVLVK